MVHSVENIFMNCRNDEPVIFSVGLESVGKVRKATFQRVDPDYHYHSKVSAADGGRDQRTVSEQKVVLFHF